MKKLIDYFRYLEEGPFYVRSDERWSVLVDDTHTGRPRSFLGSRLLKESEHVSGTRKI